MIPQKSIQPSVPPTDACPEKEIIVPRLLEVLCCKGRYHILGVPEIQTPKIEHHK